MNDDDADDYYSVGQHSLLAIPDRKTETADAAELQIKLLYDSATDIPAYVHVALVTSDGETKQCALSERTARMLCDSLIGYIEMIQEGCHQRERADEGD